jgi:DNA-binding transcriptional regulator YdaS (Cro superfamily)
MRKWRMTSKELRKAMRVLEWDQTSLAEHLGIQRSSVQRWCSGVYTVPAHVAAWIAELAELSKAGNDERYNAVLDALPHGWQGENANGRTART